MFLSVITNTVDYSELQFSFFGIVLSGFGTRVILALKNGFGSVHSFEKHRCLNFWQDSTVKPSQFSSVAQSCLTLCNPTDCSTSGFPIHHQLPVLAQTYVHRVGDAIQPSHPLKLQYFGHLMQRTDSLEKTLTLGKMEGRRTRNDRG